MPARSAISSAVSRSRTSAASGFSPTLTGSPQSARNPRTPSAAAPSASAASAIRFRSRTVIWRIVSTPSARMIATVARADMRTEARAPSVTFTASAIAPHWARGRAHGLGVRPSGRHQLARDGERRPLRGHRAIVAADVVAPDGAELTRIRRPRRFRRATPPMARTVAQADAAASSSALTDGRSAGGSAQAWAHRRATTSASVAASAGRERAVAAALELCPKLLPAHAAPSRRPGPHLPGARERRRPGQGRPRLEPDDRDGAEPGPRRVEPVEGGLERRQHHQLAPVLLDEVGGHPGHAVRTTAPGRPA